MGSTGGGGGACLATRLAVLLVRFVVVDVDARAVDVLDFVPLVVAVALDVVDTCSLGTGRLIILDVGLTMPISCARTCS